ncbi:glycosyltransferase [Flavobacterium sp. NG2]|uniref:glycosyltransferase n=1 Tax=Flavobacterium sp. NG2 TaxID=3097547 RepID=UPI002A80A7BB|nr:glycosyltransferase [Flavobacterium sp. NG2]WPR72638.1 glycosyltransferase [Flavobacterium sp. NG2]
MTQEKKLLVIGFVWPEPNSSAAGTRMLQIIQCFKQDGYKIVFASAASDSEHMVALDDFVIEKVAIELNASSFDVFIKDLQPSVVLFDRFMTEEQFGWRVAENCPKALRILDTEDLHCLRLARQKAFKANVKFTTDLLLKEEVAKREIASILRSDVSIMISKYEIELLTTIFNIDSGLLFYMPFLLDTMNVKDLAKLPSFHDRKDFVFIGNFLHEPNWNTVQYLKETIWPLIRKQKSDAVLNVYGAYPSQKVLQLHNPKEGFYIKGRAENAQEVIQKARVLLAPIRFGAGLKGKLVEAMLYGTPTLTSSVGAEAMRGNLDWNGFIEDESQSFAKAAIALYEDEYLWLKSQKKGIDIVNHCYSKLDYVTNFMSTISLLLENMETHRLQNFMGTMLMHHSLQSTKYMSRWIEEKNRK